MKIIFLDIDGVVNCEETFQRHRGVIGIDPHMAFMVGKICLDTGAKLVLSSSWRGYKEGEEEIRKQIGEFIDRTPRLDSVVRGEEIKAWLDIHPEVTKYAILDDDNDMLSGQHLFQTSWKTGLTKEVAESVTKHLNT